MATAAAPSAAAGGSAWRIAEDFERGLCVAPCRGAHWAFAQRVDGKLETVAVGGRNVLRATTGPRGDRVPKAALVARPGKAGPGSSVDVAFDLMIPRGAPLNSVHLVDVECATCGTQGNPGIRLYLRHGRLRIDRSKIGVRHAWVDDEAPQLEPGRWHRVEFSTLLGEESGAAAVRVDGSIVLRGKGATIVRSSGGSGSGADRVQIGITASSNASPAIVHIDNVRIAVGR
ncbi:MAG TPA: hypothetical protein VGW34_02725 [Allosphingosinicella sp.]|nr:hypothetical protein [Allosphingosinicella sp.]